MRPVAESLRFYAFQGQAGCIMNKKTDEIHIGSLVASGEIRFLSATEIVLSSFL